MCNHCWLPGRPGEHILNQERTAEVDEVVREFLAGSPETAGRSQR
jgi:hypothetical protein